MDANTLFHTADEQLAEAKEEMMKPEEDLVPYSVCQKSFYAISNYLKGFLHRNGRPFDENMDMADLIGLVSTEKPEFSDLDNSFLKHPKETEDVWMNLDRASDFIDLAEKTRSIVGLK